MLTYSNPRMTADFSDWPFGSLRTACSFVIETDSKKGQRVSRTMINPKTGRVCKPKLSTYSDWVRIVDGSDGKTYIAHYSEMCSMFTIEQSNMKFNEESISRSSDVDRYTELVKLREESTQ